MNKTCSNIHFEIGLKIVSALVVDVHEVSDLFLKLGQVL